MAEPLSTFLISLAVSVAFGIASQLVQARPRGPKPLVQDEFKLPTTEDGREIPWVFGRVVCSGPNVLHYRLRKNQKIKKKSGPFSKSTVGLRYSFALHFGICSEPETVHAIRWGGKDVIAGAFTEDPNIKIFNRNFFGGDSSEGGLDGVLRLLFGRPDQTLTGTIALELPEGPNFRGWLCAYWEGFCTTTPYIKPLEAEVSRYTAGWESGSAWYPETAYVPLNEAAEDGLAAEFSFMFVHPKAGVMDTVIPLSSITYRDLVDQQFNAWIDKIESIKTLYGSTIKINVGVSQYVTPGPATSTTRINVDADDLDYLRTFYAVQPDSGYYFINDAATAIEQLQDDLDNAGVTGTPRILFVVTAGPDTPSFVDGPTFGTPDSRLAALLAATAEINGRTGAYTVGSGRANDIYRYNIQAAGGSGIAENELHNGPLSAARNLVPSGNTPMADIVEQIVSAGVTSTEAPYFGANPAHIVYELITTARPRGMGYPTSAIDADSFSAAADVFYNERLGLCVKWEFSGSLRELIEGVATHAGAIVRQSNSTGLWEMIPLRKDYTAGSLPLFNAENILRVSTFERAGGGEQVSSITGKYRDVFVREDRVTPAARNLALIQQQGADIAEQRDYPYAPTASIASRLVDRDLQTASLPLALIEIECNRTAYSVQEGDVIRVVDARIGVNPIIMRVLSVDEGSLDDGAIVLRGNEDQFALADNVYTAPQPIDENLPDTRPLPSLYVSAYELPYEIITQPGGPSSIALGIGYVGTLAAPPENLLTDYTLYAGTDISALLQEGEGQFIPFATIATALTQTSATIALSGDINLDEVEAGDYAIIGTGQDAEWTRVTAIDVDAPSVTVDRGLIDTTPTLTPWPIGTSVWFSDGTEAAGETPYTDGDEVFAAVATVSQSGELLPENSPTDSVTMANRASRPLPPGNVLINAEAYPVTITGTLTITWSARDRLTQPGNVLQTNASDFGPEVGTTYNVWAYDVTTETLLDSDTGLTSATWSPVLPDAYPLRIEIESERDGLTSWQRQKRQFTYVSGGLEGFITDDAVETTFETDGGDVLLTD